MIVQSAPESEAHFVITMLQHTAFAGELARHFGNDDFAPLDPREPLEYVVANHDRGWDDLDARAPQDPATCLPYNLSSTPLTDIIATSAGSPDHNQRRHPLSGIISSMHSYGLYHGRYGLAPDKLFIDRIPDPLRPAADAMLEAELARQDRLREQLASDPDCRGLGRRRGDLHRLQAAPVLRHLLAVLPSPARGGPGATPPSTTSPPGWART